MNRVLAKELGPKGVTVNTVSPGPIDTELFRAGKTEQQIKFFEGLHPLKRIGRTDEVSPVVAMLASPDSSWVNGQNIRVNGVRGPLH
jgi:3-oxoacyl-[acyl-carrier protein] reductase